ncbi:MaoC/PaaZ C-terminal domain-containing protein [Pseudofrankia inefficax]|uniref:MaoC domain protein dehydratase n=1 Tax=Pseudofrankia inefficax (strain DSM 45817 / CECT 9037 / DDB 130130 / EuI1c) TaxID=298654 RepID=E3JCQ1_PSEI1|nr:MaoC/PaaZ C-terminal domain-containing protein [Pseudofrankia inefficax]ADP79891.1 MaoC domain protein dehydratase [Pseudofrankia inefficax]
MTPAAATANPHARAHTDLAHADLAHADLAVGAGPAPFVDSPLTRTDFVRYQGASGDLNPIHHDEEFARAAGFPTVFAVGMLQAGILGTYVTDWLGAANLRRFTVQFREQAWPGDVLTYTATVTALREEAGRQFVDLALLVTRQTGGTHLRGEATFVLPA